jgi:uncharacterized membrane protein
MMENEKKRFLNWRFFVAIPAAAGVVHILATLAAMNDTAHSAFALLKPALPVNKMAILPPVAPGQQPLPFLSPDARYAICHFDTANGPVAVSAKLPDHGWTIGIFNPDGSSAYFAAASPGRATSIALTIVPADDRFMGLTPEAKGIINAGQAPLTVAAREGLIVVRAPDRGLAYRAESEAGLMQASCAPKAY